MPCGWEGNRGSGVVLAMRHRLQWFIHLRAHGLRKGPRLHWSPITSSQGCRGYGDAHGLWVWGEYGDDVPSPQTHGDSMGIFNQPEITR